MLSIDLTNKKVFIAGIGDDRGFGWSIAKIFAEAGATVLIGTWAPIYKIFSTSFSAGKFDSSRHLSNGKILEFAKIYPIDGSFDRPEDVPEEIKENKRYKELSHYTLSEVAEQVHKDFGNIDILVHSLANAPEVQKPLLDTSRKGYLAAMSSSSYSFVSLLTHFFPFMNENSSALTLTYLASEKAVPGYGGGMSSAKAALESDVRTLAWEAGRKDGKGVRVNAISAGALASRAATAIGSGGDGKTFIEKMIDYGKANAPLQRCLCAEDIAFAVAFLASPLASAITGSVIYVDNGLNIMGTAQDSISL